MDTQMNKLNDVQDKSSVVEKIRLSCRQVYRISSPKKAVRIQGVKGTVYVTLPEDPEDYILRTGEEMIIRSRGLVLVQGMPEGSFQYTAY